LCADLEVKQL